MSKRKGLGQRHLALVSACALAVVATLSGAASFTNVASGAPAKVKHLQSLTVAVTSAIPEYGALYVAQYMGYFQALGLKVTTLDTSGSNGPGYLVAGIADVLYYSGSVAIGLKNQGEDIKVIGNNENFDGESLVGSSAVTSISQLQAMPSCTIGSTAVGSNNYYMAEKYISMLHLNCTIVQFASPVVSIEAAVSGSVTADVSAYGTAEPAVAAGQVHMLEDSTSSTFKATFIPKNLNGYLQIGVGTNLAKKRASVVAFEEGLIEGSNYMETHSAKKVTAVLHTQAAFLTTPSATLFLSVPAALKFLPRGPQWGYISPSQWTYDLSEYPYFGVSGITSSEPLAQYSQIIDMSYYKTALTKIKTYKLGASNVPIKAK